jgi:hypothetical protein
VTTTNDGTPRMMLACLRTLVGQITLPAPLRVKVDDWDPRVDRHIVVRVWGTWDDVDHPGQPISTHTSHLVPIELIERRPETLIDLIYDEAERLWLHEFKERTRFAGTPIRAPHSPDGAFQ